MHKRKGVLANSSALVSLKLCIFFRLFLSFFYLFSAFSCPFLPFLSFLYSFPPFYLFSTFPYPFLSLFHILLLFSPLMFCLIPLFNISLSYPFILFHSFYILKPCYNLYSFSLSSLYSLLYFLYSLPLFLLSLLYLPAL